MKYFGLLCIFLILVNFSMQSPQFENCSADLIESHSDFCKCCKVTCDSDTELRAVSCGVSRCAEGAQIGYHNGDDTLEFPACCSHPICKD